MRSNSQSRGGRPSESRHFRFVPSQNPSYGKRTGVYFIPRRDRDPSYRQARWSDYVDYDSDEITEDVEMSQGPIQRPLEVTTASVSPLKDGERRVSAQGERGREWRRTPSVSPRRPSPRVARREEKLEVQAPRQPSRRPQQQYRPFEVEISSIKKHQSKSKYYQPRSSEKYLVELLEGVNQPTAPLYNPAPSPKPSPERAPSPSYNKDSKPSRSPNPNNYSPFRFKPDPSDSIDSKFDEEDSYNEIQREMKRLHERRRKAQKEREEQERREAIKSIDERERQLQIKRRRLERELQWNREKEGSAEDRERRSSFRNHGEQNNQKRAKRVLIEDKGKLHRPTDSLSKDSDPIFMPSDAPYEPILPPSLTKPRERSVEKVGDNPNQYERARQKEEPMEVVGGRGRSRGREVPMEVVGGRARSRPREEPMEVVGRQPEQKRARSRPREESMEVVGRREEPMEVVRPEKKPGKPRKQTPAKKGNSKDPRRRQNTTPDSSPSRESKPKVTTGRQIKEGQERTGTKMRKGEEGVVEHHGEVSARPQRNRTKPTRYWQNERPIYSSQGELMYLSNSSPEQILDMIGFEHPKRLNATRPSFNQYHIRVNAFLNAGGEIRAAGFRHHVMKKHKIYNPQYFTHLEVRYQSKNQTPENDKGYQKVFVERFWGQEFALEEPVYVPEGQCFTIRNNLKRRAYLVLTLCGERHLPK